MQFVCPSVLLIIRRIGTCARWALLGFIMGAVLTLSGAQAWAADPRVNFRAAMSAYNMGDFDLAVRLYNQALQTPGLDNKARAIILSGRSHSFSMRGDAGLATNDADQSAALNPNIVNDFRRITRHQRFQVFPRSIRNLSHVIAFGAGNQTSINSLIYRGDRYAEISDYIRAMEDYDSALRLDPGNTRAQDHRAAILATLNGN